MSHAASDAAAATPAVAVSHLRYATAGSGAAAAGRQLPSDEELLEISASLRGMRYGSVNIIVQDGVIIQIDRTEKRRLRSRADGANENHAKQGRSRS
ncbi:MAG TPA: YezD family protein [Lacipirellulaceae bacterium]|nr:YezD family protein [Lacipirellulaceae bacterium]